jgi:hypothetical protein
MTAKQRQARAKFKAVVKEAAKLRKKNPKLTQAQAVKQAFAISYSKQRKGEKLGAVKKKSATKVKAKKGKSTEMHTDTKSHNVNIRVVSGIIPNQKEELEKYIRVYGRLMAEKLAAKTMQEKKVINRALKITKSIILSLKK